jgi:capsular exopolysaccharide synthesis family protein
MERRAGATLLSMEVNLRGYVRLLLKRKWWIIAALVGFLALGAAFTAQATPVYQASTSLFVGEQQITVKNLRDLQEGFAVTTLSGRLMKSYAQIIVSRRIAQRAVTKNGLPQSAAEIQDGLKAQVLLDTQVIELTYRTDDATEAARVANAVAAAFIDEIGRLQVSPDEGKPALQVSVIDRAVAPRGAPISPNPARNMAVAAVLGLVAGVGLAFLRDQFDVTVRSREDVEELGFPVLGTIPKLDTEGEQIHLERDAQGIGGESFRKLRTSIGFLGVDVPLKSVLVTSPVAQDGKTTIALNLAASFALGGFRTVLVEADLRRPSLHRVFGLVGTKGLTTTIVGDVPLNEAIVHTDTRNLSVLLAGAIPPNPVELLSSDQMAEVLDRLRDMYDMVIIDSPPLIPVADPAALAGRCDGVAIVTRAGKTDKSRIGASVQIVERAGGRLLGVVLNFLKPGQAASDYSFYPGYRAREVPSLTAKTRDA